jgi:hypothetical protein
MKFLVSLLVVVLLFVGVAPVVAQAQGIPSLDSGFRIVPDASQLDSTCPVGAPLSFGAVMHIAQNLLGIAIAFGVVIFVIMMAWAGFLLITSPFNAEAKSTARKLLGNAAIGLLITMSAWLIVDFVMKTLYNPNNSAWGPWNSILGDGPACVKKSDNMDTLFSGPITAGELLLSESWDNTTPVDPAVGGKNCPAAPESSMVAFPTSVTGGQVRKATPTTVKNFLAMHEAARKDGVTLRVTSAYRSEAEQVALWNRLGSGRAAVPCSKGGNGSNHNSGVAIDISVGCSNGQSGCNTKTYNWLKANGSKWGFRNNLPTDPLHWSPTGR